MTTRITADPQTVYPTYGVHNPPKYSPCKSKDCLYQREPDEPSDPLYPEYWTAKWTMYRVFNKYVEFPPPYNGAPPPDLKEGIDYQASFGVSYYDSTWRGPNGEEGAMMEYYDEWSLPIFPMDNHFSSAFVSLGDLAYFITYDKDRPPHMPQICLFSDLNHPPRRDFIKHLPYSREDSQRLGGKIQGYSFWTDPDPAKSPMQTGVCPDRTADGGILFGYAFKSAWEPDALDATAAPYRHPHSFYFSGYPLLPPNAPIVSQHFTEFAMKRPDPAETWEWVLGLIGDKPLPSCKLFAADDAEIRPGVQAANWAGRRKRCSS